MLIDGITHSHLEIEVTLARTRAVVDAATKTPAAGADAALALVRGHVQKLRAEVVAHAAYEEQELFPALGRLLGDTPPEIDRLVAEHKQLAGLLDALEESVGDGDPMQISANLLTFARAFDAHSEDEANILDTTANLMDPGGPAA
jgi:iron-sulfur cluster repair protein YtfE (RIC family)